MSSSKTAYVQPRVTRSSNRLCSERMDKAAYDLHKKRLSQVRPTIDNKTPAKPLHVVRNWKREQILDEKYSAIERENHLLLAKMSKILYSRGQSGVDAPKRYVTTLNRAVRRRELARITEENQGILARLQNSQPTYSYMKWELEAQENDRRITEISFYHKRPISASRTRTQPDTSRVLDVEDAVAAEIREKVEAARLQAVNGSGDTRARSKFAGRPTSAPTFKARPTSAVRRTDASGMVLSGVPEHGGRYRPSSAVVSRQTEGLSSLGGSDTSPGRPGDRKPSVRQASNTDYELDFEEDDGGSDEEVIVEESEADIAGEEKDNA